MPERTSAPTTVKHVINRILLRNEVIFMLVFLLQLPMPGGTGIQVRDDIASAPPWLTAVQHGTLGGATLGERRPDAGRARRCNPGKA